MRWKNVSSFLFFLLLAFIFWLMLFFERSVEGTYRIPLKYTNVPDNVVFDNDPPNHLDVRISDRGREIFLYDLFSRDSLEINVGENQKNRNNNLQGSSLQQLIQSSFSQSSKILGYYPMNISTSTSKLESKKLRVAFDGAITTYRTNLVADSATFLPETVMAYGAKKQLSELTEAVTEYVVFDNLKATSQLPIKIKAVQGVKFVPDKVDIYIAIEEFTEKSFEIPIKAKNMPQGLDVKFFPSQVSVSFSVTIEGYKKISADDFSIVLDYNKFKGNGNGRVDLGLTHSPSTVRNLRLSPASVEFLFETN
jgi:hypothetical protein